MPLQKPTVALIQEYVTLFSRDAECVASDAALALLVKTFPRNQEMGEVLLKVAAVNQIYNAGLQTKAIYAVARLICDLEVDGKLDQGSLDLVDEIAHSKIGEHKRYVFATKYCHWHRPVHYPIYDSSVQELIWKYKRQDGFAQFQKKVLWRYPGYKEIVDKFMEYYGLAGISYRELDKFLWRYKG